MGEMLDKILFGVKVANDNVVILNKKIDKILQALEEKETEGKGQVLP